VRTILRLSLLALRNLGTRKTRTALTTLGVVLGVGVVLATSIANQSTTDAFSGMIDSITGRADFWINGASAAGFDESKLDEVSRIDGVALAVPGVARGSTVAVGRHRESVQVAGVDPRVDRRLRDYRLAKGRFIRPGESAVVLTERLAEKLKVRPPLVTLVTR